MTIAETIQIKLQKAFAPSMMEITDESDMHIGHAGKRSESETHFRIIIVSPIFDKLSRVQRYRMVHNVIANELENAVHAVSMMLCSPNEFWKKN
ncbi:bolA-like family protein [Candidatus Endolissoclinum faulkneri L2]|uniref:BolA-like family protein n=1 Tax=Candidatus Endolissoclinum faulkneri L2 TaxID=1193729 RepID=K7YR95_9PROT|nr:BolA family protein [Candidatus Endolissoclinum faulkneri]AFX99054.1 bolA-like family protein [Candidatus Endolissoclinum faulkneri L2]